MKIKKNSKNKRLPKYMFGSNVKDPLNALSNVRRKKGSRLNTIENPNTAITKNNIAWAKAQQEANSNPWTQGLDIVGNVALNVGGNMMNEALENGAGLDVDGNYTNDLPGFLAGNGQLANTVFNLGTLANLAFGGQVPNNNVPVEIEGEEVGQMPNGQLFEANGPSHENGGIDIALPEGTEMFSNRIKVDGISMADRKKKRKKREMTLENLLEMNSTDMILKNSLNKTKENNKKQNKFDTEMQTFITKLVNSIENKEMNSEGMDERQQYKLGTTITGKPYGMENNINKFNNYFDMLPSSVTPISNSSYGKNFGNNINNINNSLNAISSASNNTTIPVNAINPVNETNLTNTRNQNNKYDTPTFGDGLGLVGDLISTFGPYNNTLNNRSQDNPNINPLKNYGKRGLQTLDNAKGYVNQVRDNKLREIDLMRNNMVKRSRNSARGVNTMRALDLAANQSINKYQSDTYNHFANQMLNLLNREAAMQNQQDQLVMKGEDARDTKDRQDKDSYFSQLAQNIATMGKGVQTIGKRFNTVEGRKNDLSVIKKMKELLKEKTNNDILYKEIQNLILNTPSNRKTKSKK